MVKLRDIWQNLYPYGVFRTGKAVYLTFDDGPIPEVTPRVLEILDRYGVKATFFMVGENIDKHPDIFRQVVAGGHSVGNHTYNHLKGWQTPYEEYLANLQKCQSTINRHLEDFISTSSNLSYSPSLRGRDGVGQLYRPPYGKATFRQRKTIASMGYRLIYWDVLTRDYDASVTPEQMFTNIQRQTRPGSIINFHDSIKSNERTLSVLPQAIEWLQEQGYTLLPL